MQDQELSVSFLIFMLLEDKGSLYEQFVEGHCGAVVPWQSPPKSLPGRLFQYIDIDSSPGGSFAD